MASEDLSQDGVVFDALSRTTAGHGLSARQLEVLTLVTRGLSRAEVAAEMGVTVATVDYHGRVIRQASGLGPRDLVLRLLRDALVAACAPRVGELQCTHTKRGTFYHR